MADQTVRTIYEANVSRAQRNLSNLARDTDRAADSVDKLDGSLDRAGKRTVNPTIDVDIKAAEAEVRRLTAELDSLEKADADVRVEADVQAARGDLARAEADLQALQGAKAEMVVTVDADDVDLDEMGDAAEEAGANAGSRAGNAILEGLNSTPVVGAVAGIVVAAGGFIASGVIDAINEHIRAEDVFGASAGLDEATARKFGAAAGRAYGNAWGESVEDNLNTAQRALENGLIDEASTGREIQVVTEQLSALTEIMDVDVVEAAEAAGNMVKNGLAANAEEAFDIILTGQQDGLNRSQDWLDTWREYSPMFETLGLTGAEAGSLIADAMDAGARNSDVAADALKEFSIRAQDDSKATREAFEDLGLDADEMGDKIAQGGETAKEGLDEVLDGLRSIEDPVQRNLAGVALFGTMWEDMGNGAGILAMDLDDLGDSWVNVGDTTADAMNRMSDNAATAWESMKRNVTDSAVQVLGGIASTFEDPILDLSAWVSTHTNEILGFLVDLGYGFFDLARAAVEFAATTVEVLGDVAGSMDVIVDGAGKAVEALGHMTGDQDLVDLGLGIQGAADSMTEFSENSDAAADTLRTEVGGALDEAERKFEEWTGPALMQAEVNDAVNEMIGRVDEFSAHVDEAGGDVTINGDTLPAEEALNEVIGVVAESNGTVNINGETYPVEEALDQVIALVNAGEGEITVTANTGPTEEQVRALIDDLNTTTEAAVVNIGADTTPAEEEINSWSGTLLHENPAYVPVSADTAFADEQVEAFYATMMEHDWEIEINGETVGAEQALAALVDEINAGEGTVMINGVPTDAETALLQLISHINGSGGTVEIDGDAGKAFNETGRAVDNANSSGGTIDIDGDNSGANSATASAKRNADSTTGTIDVEANTWGANAAINSAARTRTAYINVVATGATSLLRAGVRNIGRATGGQIPGYGAYTSGYGVVPGPSAPYGVDNVLWPSYAPAQPGRATGGPILSQPLAGGEWVVNPISSRQHDATLAAINAGASRAEIAAMNGGGSGASTIMFDEAALGSLAEAIRVGASQATIGISDRQWQERTTRAGRRFS